MMEPLRQHWRRRRFGATSKIPPDGCAIPRTRFFRRLNPANKAKKFQPFTGSGV
jgi:hypothetical protein